MDVKIVSRSGKDMGTLTITHGTTLDNFKSDFHKKNRKFYPERQWFTVNEARGLALKEGSAILTTLLKSGDVLVFKDLGA
jgi:very-long-chain enoyl-CoA reductase